MCEWCVVFACVKTRGALVWGISPQADAFMFLAQAHMVAHSCMLGVAQDL